MAEQSRPQEQTISLRSADEAALGEVLAEVKRLCAEERVVGQLVEQLRAGLRGVREDVAEGVVQNARALLSSAWRLGRQHGWAEAVEDLLSDE